MRSRWRVVATLTYVALLTCSVTCADLSRPSDPFIRNQPEKDTLGWTPMNYSGSMSQNKPANKTRTTNHNNQNGPKIHTTDQSLPESPKPTFDSLVRPPGNHMRLRNPNLNPVGLNRPQFILPGPRLSPANPSGQNRPHIVRRNPNKSLINPPRRPGPMFPGRQISQNHIRSERHHIHPGWARRPQFRAGQPKNPGRPQGIRRPQVYRPKAKRYWDSLWDDSEEDIWFDPQYAENHNWGDEPATPKPNKWTSTWGDWPFMTSGSSNDRDGFISWLTSGGRRNYKHRGHRGNSRKDPPWHATRRISNIPNRSSDVTQTPGVEAAGVVGLMSIFVSTLTVLYMASSLMDGEAKAPTSPFQDIADSFWNLHGKVFGALGDTRDRQLPPEIRALNFTNNEDLLNKFLPSVKNEGELLLSRVGEPLDTTISNYTKVNLVQLLDALINKTKNASNHDLMNLNTTLSTLGLNQDTDLGKLIHGRSKRSLERFLTLIDKSQGDNEVTDGDIAKRGDSEMIGRQFDPISQIAISAGMVLGAYIGYSFINGGAPNQNKKPDSRKDFALRRGSVKTETQSFSDDFDISLPDISEENLSLLIQAVSNANKTLNSTFLATLLPQDHSTSDSLTAYLTSLKEFLNSAILQVNQTERNQQDIPSLNINEPNLMDLLLTNISLTSTSPIPSFTPPHPALNFWDDPIFQKVIPGKTGSSEVPLPEPDPDLLPHMTALQTNPDMFALGIDPDASVFHTRSPSTASPVTNTVSSEPQVTVNIDYDFLNTSPVYFRPKIPITSHPNVKNYSLVESSVFGLQSSTTTSQTPHIIIPNWVSITEAPVVDIKHGPSLYQPSESQISLKKQYIESQSKAPQTIPQKLYTFQELNSQRDTVKPQYASSQQPEGVAEGGNEEKLWQRIDTITSAFTKSPPMQSSTSKPSWPHYKEGHFNIDNIPTQTTTSTTPFSIPGHTPPKSSSQSELSNQHQNPSYYMNQKYQPTQSPINHPTPSFIDKPTHSPIKHPTPSSINHPTTSPIKRPTPSSINQPTPSPIKYSTLSPIRIHTKAENGHVSIHKGHDNIPRPSLVTNEDSAPLRIVTQELLSSQGTMGNQGTMGTQSSMGTQGSYDFTHNHDHIRKEPAAHISTATYTAPFSVKPKLPKDGQHYQQQRREELQSHQHQSQQQIREELQSHQQQNYQHQNKNQNQQQYHQHQSQQQLQEELQSHQQQQHHQNQHQHKQQHDYLFSGVGDEQPAIPIHNQKPPPIYTNDGYFDSSVGNKNPASMDPSQLLDKDTFSLLLDLARREWHTLQWPPPEQKGDNFHQMQGIRNGLNPTTLSPVTPSRPGTPSLQSPMAMYAPPDLREIPLPQSNQFSSYTQNYRPQTVHNTPSPITQFPPATRQSFHALIQEVLADMNKPPVQNDPSLPGYLNRYVTKRKLEVEDEDTEPFKQNLRLLFEVAAQNGIQKEDIITALSKIQGGNENSGINGNQKVNQEGVDIKGPHQKHPHSKLPQNSQDAQPTSQISTQTADSLRYNHPQLTDRPSFVYGHQQATQSHPRAQNSTTPSGSLITWSTLMDNRKMADNMNDRYSTSPLDNTNEQYLIILTDNVDELYANEGQTSTPPHPSTFQPLQTTSLSDTHHLGGNLRTSQSTFSQPSLKSNTPSQPLSTVPGFSSYIGSPSIASLSGRPSLASGRFQRPKSPRILREPSYQSLDQKVVTSELNFERTGQRTGVSYTKGTTEKDSVDNDEEWHPVVGGPKDILKSAPNPTNSAVITTGAYETKKDTVILTSDGPVSLNRNKDEFVRTYHHQSNSHGDNNSNDPTYITNSKDLLYTATNSKEPANTVTTTLRPSQTTLQFNLPTLVPTYMKQPSLNQPPGTTLPVPSTSPMPLYSSTLSSPLQSQSSTFSRPIVPSQPFPYSISHVSTPASFSNHLSPALSHPSSALSHPSSSNYHSSASIHPSSALIHPNSTPNNSSLSNHPSFASQSPLSNPTPHNFSQSPSLMSSFLCRHAKHHQACVICMEEVGQRAECLMRRP